MLDATFDLWRTTCIVWTIPGSLAFISYQGRAAFRTTFDKLHRLCDDGALVDVDTHNLRDNLTALLHIDIIADMQVKTLDEVLIVQCGALYGSASQLHGIHIGHRGDGTCTPHLISYLVQTGTYSFCLELISNGPAWTLGRET